VAPARVRVVARLRFLGSASQRFMFGSMLVHVLIAATLLALPAFKKKPHFPENALIVELAPAASPAPPATKVSPPVKTPTPAPEPDEGVRVETKEPPKQHKPPEEKPKEKPVPQPLPAEPEPQEQQAEGGGPEMLGGPDAGHSIAAMEGGDIEFAWYRASVTAALYSNWRRPILSGISEPMEVSVSFEILRDGSVVNLNIDSSSGAPSLDRSALRAVTEASPLPPLPAQWRESRLSALFAFRLYPEGF
jgi:protein TonB